MGIFFQPSNKQTIGLSNVSNVAQIPLSYLDTDITLAANSDSKVASQKAIKGYISALNLGTMSIQNANAVSLTGNMAMGSNKITGLANGTISTDAINYGQLTSATLGILPVDPIATTNVVDDTLSTPPISPLTNAAYLVATLGVGDWLGKAGHIMEWNGSVWIDVLGRAVISTDRFGINLEGLATAAGGLVGKDNNIAQIVVATPGMYTYTFTPPSNSMTVAVNGTSSHDIGHLYYYNGTSSAWIDFALGFTPNAGFGILISGLTVSVDTSVVATSINGLSDAITTSDSIFMGAGSGSIVTSGTKNTSLGEGTFQALTSGYGNTAIGNTALAAITTTNHNTAIGYATLTVAGVSDNTAIGYNALNVATGTSNTAVGSQALLSNTSGNQNTAVGLSSLAFNLIGIRNTAIGSSALQSNTADQNTAVGYKALYANTTGTPNTAIGYQAGLAIIGGINNVCVGSSANVTGASASNQIAIGSGATAPGDNKAQIGNASITDIYFGNNTAILHGDGSALTNLPNPTTNANLTGDVTSVGNATTLNSNYKKRTIGFSATTPTTGQQGSYFVMPVAGTITAWSIVVDTGTATVQTWKVATGTTAPTVSNSISTSGVAISTGTAIRSTTLTDFTSTAVSANDIFAFNLSAVSGATKILFELEITVT